MGKHRAPKIDDVDRTYDVGYRKPPASTRFQEGNEGNKKGRKPRARRSFYQYFDEALNRLVTVKRNGKLVRMPFVEAVVFAHITKAAQGDPRSTQLIFKFFGDGTEQATPSEPLTAEDEAILQSYLDDVAAGQKAVNGSYPDEYQDYKEPKK